MKDPTREEMLKVLQPTIDLCDDGVEFDVEQAIYWFANDYHSGQWSELYSVLCSSEYEPGSIESGPEKGSYAELLYEHLVEAFE